MSISDVLADAISEIREYQDTPGYEDMDWEIEIVVSSMNALLQHLIDVPIEHLRKSNDIGKGWGCVCDKCDKVEQYLDEENESYGKEYFEMEEAHIKEIEKRYGTEYIGQQGKVADPTSYSSTIRTEEGKCIFFTTEMTKLKNGKLKFKHIES